MSRSGTGDQGHAAAGASRIGDLVADAFEAVTRLCEVDPQTKRRKGQLAVPTGFRSIDRHTHGLWPGELTVVTGGPGAGKTSFASNVAVSAAKLGARVLFVTYGANATLTVIRMLAAQGRLRASDLLSGRIFQGDWASLAEAANALSELDLFVCDDPFLAPEGLLSLSEELADGGGKALVVVDGAELMGLTGDGGAYGWRYAAGAAAAFLKGLARAIDSPVLAAFGYGPGRRREVHRREDVFDVLPDGVEGAADSILHIGRNPAGAGADGIPSGGLAQVAIAKSAVCAPAGASLRFHAGCSRFEDLVDDPQGHD